MFGALGITLGQDSAQTNIGRVRVQEELRSKVRRNNDRVADKEAFQLNEGLCSGGRPVEGVGVALQRHGYQGLRDG